MPDYVILALDIQRAMRMRLVCYLWPLWLYNIQGVSRLEDITAGGDFLGLCDEKSSYKHVSDF